MKPFTITEEQQLVQRLTDRDEQALTYFYKYYKHSMLFTIQRLVRNQQAAEDILQESMLKFWLSFSSYDSRKGRLFTWALNICRNLAIDHLRQQRRAREATAPLCSQLQDSVAAPVTFKPEHVGVREWLNLVATTDRQLLALLYLEDHTHAEAAAALCLPLGTVKSRSRRLVHLLAQAVR